MEIRKEFYRSGLTGTIVTLSPAPGLDNLPGDFPLNQLTINIANTPAGSCSRFWGTASTSPCNRYECIIRLKT